MQGVLGADTRHYAGHTARAPSHARSSRYKAAAQSTRLAAIWQSARRIHVEGAWLQAADVRESFDLTIRFYTREPRVRATRYSRPHGDPPSVRTVTRPASGSILRNWLWSQHDSSRAWQSHGLLHMDIQRPTPSLHQTIRYATLTQERDLAPCSVSARPRTIQEISEN